MNEIQEKKFKVEKQIFYNAESHWGVLATTCLDDLGGLEKQLMNNWSNITLSGNFDGVYVGAEVIVSGSIVESKYGKQIQISSLKVSSDHTSKESVVAFLTRSVIKGINVQNAKKIFNTFKDKAIDVVLNNPDKLSEIRGIGKKTVKKVKESSAFYKKIEALIKYCTSLGVPYSLILKLHNALGENALTVIKETPYKILELSNSISFSQIDDIYLKNGGNPTGRERLETALLYSLKKIAVLEGSTGCTVDKLRTHFYKLLELTSTCDYYEKILYKLDEEGKVTLEEADYNGYKTKVVYYQEFLKIERSIANMIKALESEECSNLNNNIPESIIQEEINNFPFKLNAQQVAAIRGSLNKNVCVLTGSAGCLAAESIISYNRTGNSKLCSIEKLYHLFNGHPFENSRGFCRTSNTYVRSFIESSGLVRLNKIASVVYSGEKEVYKLELEDGKVLRATPEHKIMTRDGWKALSTLTEDDFVMIGDRSKTPKFAQVKSVKADGVSKTYDICCHKDHNFLADGMIVHNSGKSSITKALANIFHRSGMKVVLLAPTAKACRRLEECIPGFKAQTIHKFLKLRKDNNYNTNVQVENDTVIFIDEASMMDILLFKAVLSAANTTTRVVLIGDNKQLPSVQAGNVLGDLVNSKGLFVSVLTDIMRQKEDSHIIDYCNQINDGTVFDPCQFPDFHYEEFGTGEELLQVFLPAYEQDVQEFGLNDVQVIAPYKNGELGMNALNKLLQKTFNKDGKVLIEPFRVGDKVRHTVNDYTKEVFNGETGVVMSEIGFGDDLLEEDPDVPAFLAFDEDEDEDSDSFLVDYGDRLVSYDGTDASDLTLAYASTVHASQGSEYAVVYVILDDTSVNDFLHIRRLLYTAVSRGKKKVYILTKPYLVDNCIRNESYRPRITKLKDFMEIGE